MHKIKKGEGSQMLTAPKTLSSTEVYTLVMLSLLFFDFLDDFLGVSESEPAGESLGVTSLLQKQTQVLNRPQHDAQMPNIRLRYVSGQNKE